MIGLGESPVDRYNCNKGFSLIQVLLFPKRFPEIALGAARTGDGQRGDLLGGIPREDVKHAVPQWVAKGLSYGRVQVVLEVLGTVFMVQGMARSPTMGVQIVRAIFFLASSYG